jgi:hypothetical protein
MRNVDSRIHSPQFDCCVFLFHSFTAVTLQQNRPGRDLPATPTDVRSWGCSRKHVLVLSLTGFDPSATWAAHDFRSAKALFVVR